MRSISDVSLNYTNHSEDSVTCMMYNPIILEYHWKNIQKISNNNLVSFSVFALNK